MKFEAADDFHYLQRSLESLSPRTLNCETPSMNSVKHTRVKYIKHNALTSSQHCIATTPLISKRRASEQSVRYGCTLPCQSTGTSTRHEFQHSVIMHPEITGGTAAAGEGTRCKVGDGWMNGVETTTNAWRHNLQYTITRWRHLPKNIRRSVCGIMEIY